MSRSLCCALAACAVIELPAMPTKDDAVKAAPSVHRLMAAEREAFKGGRKTRGEVADAALKLAKVADTDATKLLLMKGAFIFYVKEGDLEAAAKTMNGLEQEIVDLPPCCVTNIVETALLGLANENDVRDQLYRLLGRGKAKASIQGIIGGMIKVPGRNYWLSATEVTQGQWESVMGYNLSHHKGANLPVENVSRDECAIFLEKLNASKEAMSTQFEFGLPTLVEWSYAAQAGGSELGCWIKPGVVGNVLDMAWVAENSSNETHVVATKAPNAFGFYDMLGNVWEWMDCKEPNVGCRHGGSFCDSAANCTVKKGYHCPRNRRFDSYGFRLAAHLRTADETCPDNY